MKLFARYAELTGEEEVILDLPEAATVADAVSLLRSRVPNGESLPAVPMVALNCEHVLPDESLAEGDELALLPPLAGG
ncbi:MAG: MoaD/ThiS family protein [Gemmatimonadales bacterium]